MNKNQRNAMIVLLLTVLMIFITEMASALPVLAWEGNERAEKWTQELVDSVAFSKLPDIYPSDASSLCRDYASKPRGQRVEFWSQLISAMVKWESNYKPETILRECSKNSCIYSSCRYHPTYGYCMKGGHHLDGGLIISRGLGQMSFQSALGYGCDLKNPTELHDPIKNLKCMVKIAESLVARDKLVMGKTLGSWRGVSRYWSVTRGVNDYTKKSLPAIRRYVKSRAICL